MIFRNGWPRPLWPLGRWVNRHRDPFTGRWSWRAYGALWVHERPEAGRPVTGYPEGK